MSKHFEVLLQIGLRIESHIVELWENVRAFC
jgi:hypothetical protein